MYEIEKGVPVEPAKSSRSARSVLVESMSDGDSVVVPDVLEKAALLATIKRHGFHGVSRRAENGFRVWKFVVKPKETK